MITELREGVSTLIATARAAHPTCPDWQLTMNPETYLLFDPDRLITLTTQRTVASYFDGCRVWPEPTWANTVVCSPMVAPGTWDLPPEYYLDLRDGSISTEPPLQTRTIQTAQPSLA
jgi:hypothetical protein